MPRILIIGSFVIAVLGAALFLNQKPAEPPAKVLRGHLDLAGSPLRPLQPSEPVTLSFKFQFEGAPSPVPDYDVEHDKLMHTVANLPLEEGLRITIEWFRQQSAGAAEARS